MVITLDSFPKSATTMQYGSPHLDAPINTQGQIRCSSKGSALVAIGEIGQPRKPEW